MNSLLAIALVVFCEAVICLADQEEGYENGKRYGEYRYRNRYGGYRYKNRYGGYRHRNRYEGYRYKTVDGDSTTSQCNQDNCFPIESPQNGQMIIEKTTNGLDATFSCAENYTLCGSSNATCGNDGKWDGNIPACVGEDFQNLTVEYQDSKYYFSSEKLTFNDSQMFCENLGGNLVSINSHSEWEFIQCIIPMMKGDIYIGMLYNNGTEEWISGEDFTVSYLDTSFNIVGRNCGLIFNSDGFRDHWYAYRIEACYRRQWRFICEIKK